MSDRDSPSWRCKRAERVRQKEAAAQKRQEGQQDQEHVQVVAALNDIANEQRVSRYQKHAYEGKKGSRETLTIMGIFAAAVVSFATLIFAHRETMRGLKEARIASGKQHDDTMQAIGEAANAAIIQHHDTLAALERAKVANDQAARVAAAAERTATDEVRPIVWLTNDNVRPNYAERMPTPGRIEWDLRYTNFGKGVATNVQIAWCIEIRIDGIQPRCARPGQVAPLPPNKIDFLRPFPRNPSPRTRSIG
jgi:hypothetical protein